MSAGKLRAWDFGAADFTAIEKRIAIMRAPMHDDEYLTEYKTLPPEFFVDATMHGLSMEEWRWAVALRRVYNVTAKYFEKRKPKERADIIGKLTELARKNGRAGRKAAEAVAIVFEMTLDRKEPRRPMIVDIEGGQVDAYRYLFEMLSTSKERKP